MLDQVSVNEKPASYKVSVIIPVYNVEEYIAETLQSINHQTLKGIQIIIINDGSTDGSDDIIQSYCQMNDEIVYIKQDHAGPGAARNKGLELSKGAFICFVDSDDLLPEDALEVMYSAAIREHADMITGASISFNSSKIWYIDNHANKGVYNPGSKTLSKNPELLFSLGPCYKLYKRELIETVRFPVGIKVTEDHPFVIEAYLRAKKIYTVDKIIYKYRRREAKSNISLSQSVRVNPKSVIQDIMDSIKISDRLWDSYVTDEERKAYMKGYYYQRMLLADIWPALINLLRNKQDDVNSLELSQIFEWILHIDQPVLAHLDTFGLQERLKALRTMAIRKTTLPITKRIFIERLQKLERIGKQLVGKAIGYRVVYPMFKRRRVENKILFISSKITESDSIIENLEKDMVELWPNYNVKIILQKPKGMRDVLAYLIDLATASVIIADDYSNPFQNLLKRSETKIIHRRKIYQREIN